MNNETDFQSFGKKMPYKIPEGFFINITGETLQKAHARQKAIRKRLVIWRSLSVAASLVAFAVTGILLFSPVPEKESIPVARKTESVTPQEKPPVKQDQYSASMAGDHAEETFPVKEEMEDLLVSISDDELLEWALILKTDYFMHDSENNLP